MGDGDQELGLVPSRSFVVGDQMIDMELAARGGAKGVWFRASSEARGQIPPAVAHVVANLWEAARWVASVDEHQAKTIAE